MENQELLDLLDDRAKCLVGIICKRVEILEKEGVLTSSLFKSLTKETIYEEFRTIKTLIKIGKLVFRNKDPQK